jgi:hypothetical protein
MVLALSVLSLAGCKTMESALKPLDSALNPKSDKQILSDKMDNWSQKKSQELSSSFSQGYPLFKKPEPGRSGRVERMSEEELSKLKNGLSQFDAANIEEKLANHDGSMQALYEEYGDISYALDLVSSTRSYVEQRIRDAGTGMGEDLGLMLGSPGVVANCNELSIENCSPNRLGYQVFLDNLPDNNPDIYGYYEWLSERENALASAEQAVSRYGVSVESEIYLDRAQNSECGQLTAFNFWGNNMALSRSFPYTGDRPDPSKIYDLAGFKVLQSAEGGVLLKPNYQDSYRAEPIFLNTNKSYADGRTFKGGDQLVCFTGDVASYTSVLGAQKNVYRFSALSDSKKYYFLPWSK